VIYNEVIDVMRSVMHIFKKKKEDAKRKKLMLTGNQVSSTIKQLLEDEDKDENEGFIMEKSLIIEAWTRYRPNSKDNSPRDGNNVRKRDIHEIYGEAFIQKLLANVKQKKYAGKDQKITEDDKLKQHLTNLLVGTKMTAQPEDDEGPLKVPEAELHLIEDFLDKFIFISDSSTTKDIIDLNLALKALPLKVEEFNIYRIDLINFNLIQKSLIAFQNDDQDELFNYYDNRNKNRLRKIMKKATENDYSTEEIKNLTSQTMKALDHLCLLLGTVGISNVLSEKEKNRTTAMSQEGGYSKIVPLGEL
jgi:hypothetical protein